MALVIEHASNDDDVALVVAVVIDGDYSELDWVKGYEIDDNGILYLAAEENLTGNYVHKYTVVKNWDQVAWVPVGSLV